jgi:CRP/FNR family transcriptional regulator, cyclic AMP receptor protein
VLTIADAVHDCALFEGLAARHLAVVAGCGRFVRFPAGATILREGAPADRFFVLRKGSVGLEVASPERGPIVVQTLGPGDTLGWSWLFPPYRWHLDAVARDAVATIAFDAACLRGRDAAPADGHAPPAPGRVRPWQPLRGRPAS